MSRRTNDADDLPPGFGLHRPEDGAYGGSNEILVPNWLSDEIKAERRRREQERLEQARSEKAKKPDGVDARRPGGSRSWHGGIDVAEEQSELDSFPEEDAPGGFYPVYDRAEPLRMLANLKESTPDRDRIAQIEGLYTKLKELGRFRSVLPSDTWVEELSALDQSHPHFAAVTQVVRERLLLSERTGRPPHIPPILLLGQAGVGKTHFAKALAEAIGTSFRQLQFDAAITDAALLGSDKRWGNTSYGALFDVICLGKHANPVFLLDELDKAPRDKRNDPLAPLHSLLEPVSAPTTRDISLDFIFDSSRVIWIATANMPWLIPQPLRTRFKEFWIPFPNAEDSIKITRSVARSVVAEYAPEGFESPGDDIGVLLGHLTAREAYQAVSDALARAVADGRHRLDRRDFSVDVLLEQPGSSSWLH